MADDLRDPPGHRSWLHERIRRKLAERRLPFVAVVGSHEAWMARAQEEAGRLLIDLRTVSVL